MNVILILILNRETERERAKDEIRRRPVMGSGQE